MRQAVTDYGLYEALGLRRGATIEQVRSQYRRLIRQAHPDAGGDARTAARLNHAYSVLSDPSARADYESRVDILRHVANGPSFSAATHERGNSSNVFSDPTLACAFCSAFHGVATINSDSRCPRCTSPLMAPFGGTPQADCQRTAYRTQQHLDVQLITPDTRRGSLIANTENLSLSGLLLVSKQALHLKQRVRVVSDTFDSVCEVTRGQQRRAGWRTEFLAGLAFVTLRMNKARGSLYSAVV